MIKERDSLALAPANGSLKAAATMQRLLLFDKIAGLGIHHGGRGGYPTIPEKLRCRSRSRDKNLAAVLATVIVLGARQLSTHPH